MLNPFPQCRIDVSESEPFCFFYGEVHGPFADWKGDLHFAPQIFILLEGNAEFCVEDHIFSGGPGTVMISSYWESHGFRAVSPFVRYAVITLFPFALGRMSPFGDFDWTGFLNIPPVRRHPQGVKKDAVRQWGERISELEKTHPAGFRSLQWILIHELIYTLGAGMPDTERMSSGRHEQIIPAMELVFHGTGHSVTVEEAAAACRMSRSGFCREFSRAMGEPFAHFAMRCRIGRAAALLADGRNIKDAAEMCGFRNLAHFYHVFRRFQHCTPGEFQTRKC